MTTYRIRDASPADVPLPPSRGRKTFELKADGSLIEQGPGPTDRTQSQQGRWTLDEKGVLRFFRAGEDQPSRISQIAAVDGERLVLKK